MSLERKKRHKFSLTFDTWTSSRNRCFMNINVHKNDSIFQSLSLMRAKGFMPAHKCVKLIDNK